MRRTRILTAVMALAAGLLAGSPLALAAPSAPPKSTLAADTYTWKNARIDGGGFVPGIVFNRAEKNLAYARTDIGGAYRWHQSTKTWTPLLGLGRLGPTGATPAWSASPPTPCDPNKVYAAVGTYTNSWDPNNGPCCAPSDRGASWQTTALPFKLGGNMPGRGMGERLAVDPNRNSVLYLGAPSGKGLWRVDGLGRDLGAGHRTSPTSATTCRIRPTPAATPATTRASSGSPSTSRRGTAGNATQTIYVGRRRQGQHGLPLDRRRRDLVPARRAAHRLSGPQGRAGRDERLPVPAYSDKGGPYDGGKGHVVAVRDGHRHLDEHQPGRVRGRHLLRLQRPDRSTGSSRAR